MTAYARVEGIQLYKIRDKNEKTNRTVFPFLPIVELIRFYEFFFPLPHLSYPFGLYVLPKSEGIYSAYRLCANIVRTWKMNEGEITRNDEGIAR